MVMKHPRLRSEKVITTTFRGIKLTCHLFIFTHVNCRVSTGFGRIPKDIPTNAKSVDGRKISSGFKQRQIDLKVSGYGNFGMRVTNP